MSVTLSDSIVDVVIRVGGPCEANKQGIFFALSDGRREGDERGGILFGISC